MTEHESLTAMRSNLSTLSHAPLREQLRDVESRVRAEPGVAAHRWALFQYSCVLHEWERAVQQLQTFAQLDASQTSLAHTYRDLVRAERARMKVMAGALEPNFVVDDVPSWMRGLLAALGLSAHAQPEAADEARETALDMAPLAAGSGAQHAFSWIADSDTRLGPVCEIIVAGRYRWLGFDNIEAWNISPPVSLVDLIWTPCTLKLRGGATLHGFMPARYPEPEDQDALLLGRETRWKEFGRTGVMGSGGKTWITSAGDLGLFELIECVFQTAHAQQDASIETRQV